MFDIPHSDIVAVQVDETAVLGGNPVKYRRSHEKLPTESAQEKECGVHLSRTGRAQEDSVAA